MEKAEHIGSCSDVETLSQVTPDDVYNAIWSIEQLIKQLVQLLSNCHLLYGDVAMLPRHYIDEDGKDSAFNDVESIALARFSEKEAFELYKQHLGFQKRGDDPLKEDKGQLSQVGARRCVGLIHLKPVVESRGQEIHDLVAKINAKKKWVKSKLSDLYPNKVNRTRHFYRKLLPEYVPKSITRLIHIAEPNTCRVHFSWLANGYTQDPLEREQVIELIERKNLRLSQAENCQLSFKELNDKDMPNVGYHDKYYQILPAKIHPRFRVTVIQEDRKKQRPPCRAVIPLLVVQQQPLLGYTQLRELNSLSELQANRNKKVVEREVIDNALCIYARVTKL